MEETRGEMTSDLNEYKYKKGDKEMAEKVYEITKDRDLANTLYIWSINAKKDDYRGFFKENEYSGEVEIVED